jgi:hypothetical protein
MNSRSATRFLFLLAPVLLIACGSGAEVIGPEETPDALVENEQNLEGCSVHANVPVRDVASGYYKASGYVECPYAQQIALYIAVYKDGVKIEAHRVPDSGYLWRSGIATSFTARDTTGNQQWCTIARSSTLGDKICENSIY